MVAGKKAVAAKKKPSEAAIKSDVVQAKTTTAANKGAAAKKAVGFAAGIQDNSKAAKKAAKAAAKKDTPAAVPQGIVVDKTKNAKKGGKDAGAAATTAAARFQKERQAKKGGKKNKSAKKDDESIDSDEDYTTEQTADNRQMAVEFRYLPAQFQEPQLIEFLSQFGSKVVKCICLRHKETNSSRGIALVSFDNDDAIPLVMEECNGMLLGGRTIRTKVVYLKRNLPGKKLAMTRYNKDIKRRTRGVSLKRFNNQRLAGALPSRKINKKNEENKEKESNAKTGGGEPSAIVGALIKYTEREKEHNRVLAKMGIQYEFHGFEKQLKVVPKGMIQTKRQKREAKKDAAAAKKDEGAATKKDGAAEASPAEKKAAKKRPRSPVKK